MIREFAPDALVVLSADAVYALDYAAVVDEHAAHRARRSRWSPPRSSRATPAATASCRSTASACTEYVYKPDEPATQH